MSTNDQFTHIALASTRVALYATEAPRPLPCPEVYASACAGKIAMNNLVARPKDETHVHVCDAPTRCLSDDCAFDGFLQQLNETVLLCG